MTIYRPPTKTRYMLRTGTTPSYLETLFDAPGIHITSVPPCASGWSMRGVAYGMGVSVACYIRVNGLYYTKPFYSSPVTTVNPDGSWQCSVVTGGLDEYASEFRAYLLQSGSVPPLVDGQAQLPSQLATYSVDVVQRNCSQ